MATEAQAEKMTPEQEREAARLQAKLSASQGAEQAPDRDVRSVLAAAAKHAETSKETLTDGEQVDALEWFLSSVDATELTHTIQINVGSPTRKKWIDWTVKPVDMDRLKQIRKASQPTSRRARAMGNTADFDEVTANINIVLEGTVTPDLREGAKQIGTVDPADAVRTRFAHKPGLLAQIAGEIMNISGYDDEDVREVDAVRG